MKFNRIKTLLVAILALMCVFAVGAAAEDSVFAEGWVKNYDLAETQIKWEIYQDGEDVVLSFTLCPEETEKVATSNLVAVTEDGAGIGYNKFGQQAWGGDYQYQITKAIIGDGIYSLTSGVFGGFSNMTSCEIPASLKELHGVPFEGCRALSTIYISGNEPVDGHFDLSNLKYIDNYCFDGNNACQSVTLNPDYDQTLGREVFKETALTEINIPKNVPSVGDLAFSGSNNLTKVTINSLYTSISRYAFASKTDGTGTDNIGNITIVAPLGSYAESFCNQYADTGIKFEELEGFVYEPVQTIVEGNVISGWYPSPDTFVETVNNLWSFNRETKVLTITSNKEGWNESGAQDGNGGWKDILLEIEEVVLVGNMGKITGRAFQGATNLKKVTMPAGIGQIDGSAFYGCTSLETVCIAGQPVLEGVLNFSTIQGSNDAGGSSFAGADVFNGNTASTAIYLSNKYSETAPLVLGNLPDNVKTIYGNTAYLEKFCEDNGLTYIPLGKTEDGAAYWTVDGDTLTVIGETVAVLSGVEAYAETVKNVVIPESVTMIADNAFAALTALETVTFKGNAPETGAEATPFGTQSSSFKVVADEFAVGFEGDTWNGYALEIMVYAQGDINCDGNVDIKDAVLLAQHLAGWKVEIADAKADVDGDSAVGIKDAVRLAQYLAGWKVDLVGSPENGDIEIESDRVM